MSKKASAKILKEVEIDVMRWFYCLLGNPDVFEGYFDDYMFVEQACKYLGRKECYEDIDGLNYDYFLKLIKKYKIQDLVASVCNGCDSNGNKYPIKLRWNSPLCLICRQKEVDKHKRKCGCEPKFVSAKDGLIYFDCLKKSKGEVNLEENSNLVEKRRFKNKDENVTSNQKGKSNMMPQSASNEKKNENKVSIPKVYTANGKEKAPCDLCGRFYEKQYGLAIHRSSCLTKLCIKTTSEDAKESDENNNVVHHIKKRGLEEDDHVKMRLRAKKPNPLVIK